MTKRQHYRPIYTRTRWARWRQRAVWLLVLLILMGSIWGGLIWVRWRSMAATRGFNVRGVAVSQNDGYLDFAALQNDGLKFVYLHATQGASYTDDNFASNYQRVLGTSLGVGVVQTFSFSTSAEDQAAYFEKTVGDNVGNLPIAIQVQYYGDYTAKTVAVKQNQAKLRTLVNQLSQDYGRSCVVWSTPAVAQQLVTPVLKKTALWSDTGPNTSPSQTCHVYPLF
ncbi:GH25 family lysozyme [Lactiplantibacillus herbarum]|uniref:GH25 family lysozyme n=1 Tax=Lactiplantibacillus herbarum TaxID=1670446 RepID=UPI000A7FDDC3|nr:GH25 family lysozyme [Lactiplantibacillus herbarum]